MADEPLNYTTYLHVEELLSLQEPRSDGPEHDELLFIVIHQVYELWFKQVLHELDHAVDLLDGDDAVRCGHTLRRVLTIVKVMVSQMDVLETMTPLEFSTFRTRLESGSGFQSAQFRELEFLLGHKRTNVLDDMTITPVGRANAQRRLAQRSLWVVFCGWLRRRGHAVPDAVLVADPGPTVPDALLQDTLVDVYRHDPVGAELCERLVDLDEGLQEWRYRHVKMVQRTIGTKMGTGGSTGVGYLRSTLDHPAFPDLWEIRSRL